MAAITWADVTAIDPTLASVGAASQGAILLHVETECGAERWGKFHLSARVFLAAHLGTLTKRGGNGQGGPVASESIGGISRGYAAFSPMGTDPMLDSTSWGKEFRRLRRMLGSTKGGLVT